MLDVRMGKCLATDASGHFDAVEGLVFTPDGKGLLSGSRDSMLVHWDVSWLKSIYDGQQDDMSTQDLTRGLREISRFEGHEVSRLHGLFFRLPTYLFPLSFGTGYTPFLFLLMVAGLHLAHGIRL